MRVVRGEGSGKIFDFGKKKVAIAILFSSVSILTVFKQSSKSVKALITWARPAPQTLWSIKLSIFQFFTPEHFPRLNLIMRTREARSDLQPRVFDKLVLSDHARWTAA